MQGPCFIVLSYGLLAILGPSTASQARYVIPLMGMMLGNATSGVAVGYSTIMEDLMTGRQAGGRMGGTGLPLPLFSPLHALTG